MVPSQPSDLHGRQIRGVSAIRYWCTRRAGDDCTHLRSSAVKVVCATGDRKEIGEAVAWYAVDLRCPECGKVHRVSNRFQLTPGPTETATVAEVYPDGKLPLALTLTVLPDGPALRHVVAHEENLIADGTKAGRRIPT
jgi:hypothetical protein